MVICSVRKTAKKLRLVVGDKVELIPNEYEKNKYIITKCLDRNNFIPRPPIANIDRLLIVIATIPKPDLLLVDKLIIYCKINNIEPIIVINKVDIADKNFVEDIKNQYSFLKCYDISAKLSINLSGLVEYISGSFCAVCGQSAVGKSSLINALIPNLELSTQELSQKIARGKHTTRVNEVYFYNNLIIADTPGFSNLELDIDYRDLDKYYDEFTDYLGKCRYLDCSHIKEGKDCYLLQFVAEDLINKSRYDRYVELYQNLFKKWKEKYD